MEKPSNSTCDTTLKAFQAKVFNPHMPSAFNTERTFERTDNKGNKTNHISKGLQKGIECRYTCMSEMQVDRLIIAYKRPKSINDTINPSTIFLPKTLSVAKAAVTLDK